MLAETGGNWQRVLIADQQRDTLEQLRAKLDNLTVTDYRVTVTDNFNTAVSICTNAPQDVVLLGLNLFGGSSADVVHQFAGRHPDIPVIVLAGDHEESLAENALHLGAKDYLFKNRVCGQLLSRSIDHAVEKVKLERAVYSAQFDVLTGLATRMLFMDRARQALARARRNKQLVGILFMDLNRFKPINDIYGHETGDIVLQHIAGVLNESVRTGDTVARFGGDEFVVMVEGIEHPIGIETVVEKIGATVRQPLQVGEEKLSVGASIGVAQYPTDGESVKELIHKADTAMYRAKKTGKGFAFFREDESA